MHKQAILKITGDVQGVCYRSYARQNAERLGLCGWVKNMPDGSVEIEATGSESNIREFIDLCRKGPPSANVLGVQVKWANITERAFEQKKTDRFEIRY